MIRARSHDGPPAGRWRTARFDLCEYRMGSWQRDRTAFDDSFLKSQDRGLYSKKEIPQNGNGQVGV